MAVALEKDARAVLSPEREKLILRAFQTAWADVFNGPERSKYSRWKRTRANMVFERIAVRLLEAFASDPQVRFHFQDETIKIVFDDRLLVRCKKANEKGLGVNIQTQAVLAFTEAQGELPGLSGLQKVEVVYKLNDTETAIEAILVQARDGESRLWAYPMGETAESTTILPLPTAKPPESDAADLVGPRKPSNDDKSDESEE